MTARTDATAVTDATRAVERYLHDVLTGAHAELTEEIVSNEALRERTRAFHRSFGDVEIAPRVIVASGEYAAVHFTARATHRGTYQGVAPTGRRWTASCSALFRVDGGKIADFWMTWDMLAILEQIGGIRRGPGASA